MSRVSTDVDRWGPVPLSTVTYEDSEVCEWDFESHAEIIDGMEPEETYRVYHTERRGEGVGFHFYVVRVLEESVEDFDSTQQNKNNLKQDNMEGGEVNDSMVIILLVGTVNETGVHRTSPRKMTGNIHGIPVPDFECISDTLESLKKEYCVGTEATV